jgi:hypothetical protein
MDPSSYDGPLTNNESGNDGISSNGPNSNNNIASYLANESNNASNFQSHSSFSTPSSSFDGPSNNSGSSVATINQTSYAPTSSPSQHSNQPPSNVDSSPSSSLYANGNHQMGTPSDFSNRSSSAAHGNVSGMGGSGNVSMPSPLQHQQSPSGSAASAGFSPHQQPSSRSQRAATQGQGGGAASGGPAGGYPGQLAIIPPGQPVPPGSTVIPNNMTVAVMGSNGVRTTYRLPAGATLPPGVTPEMYVTAALKQRAAQEQRKRMMVEAAAAGRPLTGPTGVAPAQVTASSAAVPNTAASSGTPPMSVAQSPTGSVPPSSPSPTSTGQSVVPATGAPAASPPGVQPQMQFRVGTFKGPDGRERRIFVGLDGRPLPPNLQQMAMQHFQLMRARQQQQQAAAAAAAAAANGTAVRTSESGGGDAAAAAASAASPLRASYNSVRQTQVVIGPNGQQMVSRGSIAQQTAVTSSGVPLSQILVPGARTAGGVAAAANIFRGRAAEALSGSLAPSPISRVVPTGFTPQPQVPSSDDQVDAVDAAPTSAQPSSHSSGHHGHHHRQQHGHHSSSSHHHSSSHHSQHGQHGHHSSSSHHSHHHQQQLAQAQQQLQHAQRLRRLPVATPVQHHQPTVVDTGFQSDFENEGRRTSTRARKTQPKYTEDISDEDTKPKKGGRRGRKKQDSDYEDEGGSGGSDDDFRPGRRRDDDDDASGRPKRKTATRQSTRRGGRGRNKDDDDPEDDEFAARSNAGSMNPSYVAPTRSTRAARGTRKIYKEASSDEEDNPDDIIVKKPAFVPITAAAAALSTNNDSQITGNTNSGTTSATPVSSIKNEASVPTAADTQDETPAPMDDDEEAEEDSAWAIEKILDQRTRRNGLPLVPEPPPKPEVVVKYEDPFAIPSSSSSVPPPVKVEPRASPPLVEEEWQEGDETEYLIKWQNESYMHVTWHTERELVAWRVKGLKRLGNYQKKRFEGNIIHWLPILLCYSYHPILLCVIEDFARRTATAEDVEQWLIWNEMNRDNRLNWSKVDRVIQARELSATESFKLRQSRRQRLEGPPPELMGEIEGTSEPRTKKEFPPLGPPEIESQYLVKWIGLPYEDCTWEFASDLVRYQAKVDYFLDRESKQWKVESWGRGKPRKFKKLEQPDYLCGGELRDYQQQGLNWLVSRYVNLLQSIDVIISC